MIVKYVNSKGVSVNLNERPYKMLISDILDYEWDIVQDNDKISGFGRKLSKKSLNIDILKKGQKNARNLINELTDIFEVDVINGVSGKLYIDDWHLPCFIYSSEKDRWETDKLISCIYGVVTDHPVWIHEQSISIPPLTTAAVSNDKVKSYPYGYTYGYPASKTATRINIDHYAESDFKMIIYGPAVDININIAGHPYCVHYQVQAGEYLTIDSRDTQPADRRVYLTKSNGDKVNVFNYRDSVYSVLKKIPPGEITIDYNRLYGIDLTIYIERSEPKWILY